MALSTARPKIQLAPAQQYEALANVRLALFPFVAAGCHAFGMYYDVIMNADILNNIFCGIDNIFRRDTDGSPRPIMRILNEYHAHKF
jgi:hypothetical protein